MRTLKRIGIAFGVFTGLIVFYLIVVIFAPGFDVPKQPLPYRKPKDRKRPKSREDVTFGVGGTTIRAWLYLPKDVSRPVPCIIMSHGLGGTKDCLLERYVLRFVEAGFAVLTYDYRHFGSSDGQPRQLFAISYQLDDLRSAVDYARTRPEIDAGKIVLWGTSSAGGYGLIVAAEDRRVAAVIGQCAGLDHEKDSKVYMENAGMGHFLRLFVHAQRDKGRSRFGLSPHTIPAVGKPGTLAMHNAPGAFDGYAQITAGSDTFENELCARLLLMPHGPDPNEVAERIRCPVLLLVCEYDNLAAPDSHERVAEALGDRVRVVKYPIGHFDIYEGEYLEAALDEKISFLKKHL